MTTVSDRGAAGSPRASWLFMPASRSGQVSVRNLRPETPAISSAYIPPSQKTGQVLVRTLRHAKAGFQPDKMAMSGGLKLPTPVCGSRLMQRRYYRRSSPAADKRGGIWGVAAAPHTPALATDTHAPLSVPPLPTCLDAEPRVYS